MRLSFPCYLLISFSNKGLFLQIARILEEKLEPRSISSHDSHLECLTVCGLSTRLWQGLQQLLLRDVVAQQF